MRNYRRKLGKRFSEGARLLWVEIERRGLGRGPAADLIGWSRGSLTRLLYGDSKPNVDTAALILQQFGIPISSWAESPTVEFVPPALREDDEAEEGVGAA